MASTILSDNGVSSGSAGIKTTADGTGALALQTTTAGGAATTALTIDTSQNVGIGTTSPAVKLHVNGGTQRIQSTGSASNAFLALQNDVGTQAILGIVSSGNSPANNFYIETNAGKTIYVDTSGNLLVGTTTQIGAEQVGISFADTSKNGLGIQVQASTSGAGFAVFRNSSGTLIGSITRNTTTNAVLYNTSSDYRLKENITPLTNALARVSALKPVQWSWKDCDGVVGEGFIAHEVQDVVPAAVSGEKDAVDADGNIKPQGMDASYLVATLTAAIQELKALTDTQASTITALTARITALENKT